MTEQEKINYIFNHYQIAPHPLPKVDSQEFTKWFGLWLFVTNQTVDAIYERILKSQEDAKSKTNI